MLDVLLHGIVTDPLPPPYEHDPSVPHAPRRAVVVSAAEKVLAVQNALRYFPESVHAVLAEEFAQELERDGHIYMRRFMPLRAELDIRAHPIALIPARTTVGKCIIHMILNNLDPAVAQFPHELITYGTNGAVFSNWAQFRLTVKYLCEMTDEQTLQMSSGHPCGLFPSTRLSPRVLISNGMVIPHYSSTEEYERLRLLGCTMYGQMTAGSWCYIGPQGIVHGTMLTVLNAGRKYLGTSENLAGKVFVTSGLGGMSGAQGKAGMIAGAVTVVAEVNEAALMKRHKQGWILEIANDTKSCMDKIREARQARKPASIAFHGNAVTLLEALAAEPDMLVDLISDQTSCHNISGGGYIPVECDTMDKFNELLKHDFGTFKEMVNRSLIRHITAIEKLVARGARFFDYGNAFLLEASRAGANVYEPGTDSQASRSRFKYPSYVQDIMGDIFSLGFGPFRWICASGSKDDLKKSDEIAMSIVSALRNKYADRAGSKNGGGGGDGGDDSAIPPEERARFQHQKSLQYSDNLNWIRDAEKNQLVVGSQARILYSDAEGRHDIALAFNKAVREGHITAPIVLSRDHHDVSGVDSPFRETSHIYDGSNLTADMAVGNHTGLAALGVTWVALHNGGGVGWGEVINGGFGFVLDGSAEVDDKIKRVFVWDVFNGVNRRQWSGNSLARSTILESELHQHGRFRVTMNSRPDHDLVRNAVSSAAAAHTASSDPGATADAQALKRRKV